MYMTVNAMAKSGMIGVCGDGVMCQGVMASIM